MFIAITKIHYVSLTPHDRLWDSAGLEAFVAVNAEMRSVLFRRGKHGSVNGT